MNKYRDKSDFEINLAIAHIFLGKDNYDWCPDKKEVYHAGMDGGDFLPCAYFDPCNNPTDAFPLIIDVKLSIHPDFYNNCESWIVRTVHIPPVKDKSLTRAICIAYLMMKEAENEKI